MSVEQTMAFGHIESSSDIAKALLNDLLKKGNRIPQHLMNKTSVNARKRGHTLQFDLANFYFMGNASQ